MLTGIHFILSYQCTFECDHCFVFGSPAARGTFTLNQVEQVLEEAVKIGTVEQVYFEGGEATLFYPLLLEGIKLARAKGFAVGIVTNGYFATSEQDAELWFRPLAELGISDLAISDDSFHSEEQDSPAKRALRAAGRMGLPAWSICIDKPKVLSSSSRSQKKGEPIVGGGVMFRGRAADTLTQGLPTTDWREFTECPHEELANPSRVHVDVYGNIHICQGISMGNFWETPLSKLVRSYQAEAHPICGPLLEGGPALLAKEYGIEPASGYVDACHLCYRTRAALRERFPQYLAPGQVYGLE